MEVNKPRLLLANLHNIILFTHGYFIHFFMFFSSISLGKSRRRPQMFLRRSHTRWHQVRNAIFPHQNGNCYFFFSVFMVIRIPSGKYRFSLLNRPSSVSSSPVDSDKRPPSPVQTDSLPLSDRTRLFSLYL